MNTNLLSTLDAALAAMKKKAEAMNIKGVAVVAYAEGNAVKEWTSKMLVVGDMTVPDKEHNLLGIAYTKAVEMADTLKDSGSGIRPPMKGEYGWQGGKVAKGKTGIVIAAFSGAESMQDVQVSQVAIDELLKAGL
jgi:hypothetical protein